MPELSESLEQVSIPYWNTVAKKSNKEALMNLQTHVKYLRLRHCHYDKKKFDGPQTYNIQFMLASAQHTLTVGQTGTALHEAVCQVMIDQKGQCKPCSAPRGALERGAEILLQRIGISSDSAAKQ
eukprot:3450629-Pyramimonas_sp.AAC.1